MESTTVSVPVASSKNIGVDIIVSFLHLNVKLPS